MSKILQFVRRLFIKTVDHVRGQELCTYCFRRFLLRDSPYRCRNLSCASSQPYDTVIDDNWPMLREQERGVLVPGSAEKTCSACGRPVSIRVCPHCHNRLPADFSRINHEVIALVGAKFSGKSHVIATLVHEINARSSQTGLLLQPLDDQTIDRYARDYEARLYNDRVTLDVTNTGRNKAAWTRLPLLFSLTQRRPNQHKGRLRAITLALFDGAGEDFINMDVMESTTRYVGAASGVILLLDPMQEQGIRQQHPDPTRLEAVPKTNDVLTRIIAAIRRERQIPSDRRIDVPIALAVSKFDEIERIVADPSGFGVFSESPPSRTFDTDAVARTSDEVESLLLRYQCDGLVSQLQQHVNTHAYFGITASGCRPQDGKFPFVRPRRVDDPLLWLLNQIGFLATAAGKRAWRQRQHV